MEALLAILLAMEALLAILLAMEENWQRLAIVPKAVLQLNGFSFSSKTRSVNAFIFRLVCSEAEVCFSGYIYYIFVCTSIIL